MYEKYVESTITIEIPEFIQKNVNAKIVTFFNVEIFNNYSKLRWNIEKRYSEFNALHRILADVVPNIPPIPGKSLKKLTDFNALTQRRLDLDLFLKECSKRKDILSNETFRTFLELDKHSPELKFNSPLKLDEFTELPLGVRDFYYYLSESILFVACSEMNITTRMDSYLSNVNMPWKTKIESDHVSVGAVYVFRLLTGNNCQHFFEKKWSSSFPEQIGTINFNPNGLILLVGLDSGLIIMYKADDNKCANFEKVHQIKAHKDRVMGLAFDYKKEFVYSCSSDKIFSLSYVNTSDVKISNVAVSNFGYTALTFDQKNERLFLTNEGGVVSVYLTNSFPPKIAQVIQTHSKNCIRGLAVYSKAGYIFTATNKGNVSVLDLGIPGREKYMTEMTYFEANIEIRIILYIKEKNEIVTGDQSGRITIWNLKTAKPICIQSICNK